MPYQMPARIPPILQLKGCCMDMSQELRGADENEGGQWTQYLFYNSASLRSAEKGS